MLFVRRTSGTALNNANLSEWFQYVLATYSAPFRFAPSELRHIFVDERCGNGAAEGPDGKGAARVMGNRWGGGCACACA